LPLDTIWKGEESRAAKCDYATEQALLIADAVKKAKAAMDAAQQRQKLYADQQRRDVTFTVGQEVLLSTVNIKPKFKGSPKFLPKWIGPFKVTEAINHVAYRLKLPPTMKLHDVFHASLLKPYKADGKVQPPPPPELIEGEWEFEVEAILSHRFARGNKLEYLVRWKGYGHEHDTWEPEESCTNCADTLSDYWARVQSQAEKKPISKRKSVKRKKQEEQSTPGPALRTSPRKRQRQ
jgi:hypothetical protein